VLEEEEGGDVEVAVDSILHMLLAKHGPEAFTWEVVDQSTSRDRLEARVWSARQEVHHIKSRGGALRSWDKPIEHGQTLNLCEPPRPRSIDVDANQRAAAKAAEASEVGTNARALAAWQVVVAGSSIGWIKLLDALRRFYAREGHARVPAFHVEGTYRLGEVLRGVRTRNDFVADCPERRVVLEEMGVVWQEEDQAWYDFLGALESFVAREKHCRVPMWHTEKGYSLGRKVVEVRSRQEMIRGRPDRLRHLLDIGLVRDVPAGVDDPRDPTHCNERRVRQRIARPNLLSSTTKVETELYR